MMQPIVGEGRHGDDRSRDEIHRGIAAAGRHDAERIRTDAVAGIEQHEVGASRDA